MPNKLIINYLEYLKNRGIRNFSFLKTNTVTTPEKYVVNNLDNKKEEQQPGNSFQENKFNQSFSTLEDLRKELGTCKRCRLHETRDNIVFGEGCSTTDVMFIGEGPGEEEDKTGRPFVGRAGQLLTKIIEAMNLNREKVYIANIVKCRPPGNRNPMEDEVLHCSPFLREQVSIINPKVIVALGSPATCLLLNKKIKISQIRGDFIDWSENIKLMPTFHPAYLLRSPSEKRKVWDDMQKVMEYLRLK